MHKRATVRETMLPYAATVTPNEGTEGGAIPAYEIALTEFHGDAFAASLPAHQGVAPWDTLWARSHTTHH